MKTAQELQQQVANLKAEIHQKDTLIAGLQAQIFELKKYRFGSSSEKDKNQLPLFNEAEAIVDALPKSTAKGKKKKTGVRKILPPELEREEETYDLDEAQKTCPKDSCELKLIGEECSEQLKFIPASVKVIKHKRLKYACIQCNKHISLQPNPKIRYQNQSPHQNCFHTLVSANTPMVCHCIDCLKCSIV
jgi:transposase